MNDTFKYQYKSPNLARLQDIFVNDTQNQFKTNYTITNKSVRSPIKGMNFEFISDKRQNETSPSKLFIKKYNRILNDFYIPKGENYITVDLDEKLKLNYLQSLIEEKRHKGNKIDCKTKLSELKNNYILGTPNSSNKSVANLEFNLSPRKDHTYKGSKMNIVKEQNNYSVYSNCPKVLDGSSSYLNTDKYKLLSQLSNKSPVNRSNFNKKEIISKLFDDDKTPSSITDRIQKLARAKSIEKDLRKKVVLTSKYNILNNFRQYSQ